VVRLLSTCLAATLLATAQPQAQFAPADPSRTETKHLTITTSIGAAAAGGKLSLYADVVPKPKMHVYAPDQTDYLPITLKIDPAAWFQTPPIQYPAAESFFFAPLNETQRVYSKPFRLTQPIVLARNAPPALTVKGTIRYQACDDAICYLPQTVGVTWNVAVKGRPLGGRDPERAEHDRGDRHQQRGGATEPDGGRGGHQPRERDAEQRHRQQDARAKHHD
jgi:hypothetical protein